MVALKGPNTQETKLEHTAVSGSVGVEQGQTENEPQRQKLERGRTIWLEAREVGQSTCCCRASFSGSVGV